MILVDDLQTYDTKLRYKQWCHMVSDLDEAELHAFARKLALKREWFQSRPKASVAPMGSPPPSPLARAIALGAVAVSSRVLVRRNYDRRKIVESTP